MARPLYVETRIDAPLAHLWARTQQPHDHARWDLRFTEITPVGWDAIGRHELRYATRVLPFVTVSGTGVNAGERHRPDGSCTSALQFASDHPLSLIEKGSGFWRYQPTAGGIRFLTGYDYRPRWGRAGRLLDTAFRPLMGWATAWSFDRLRLWLETGVTPERSRNRGLVEVGGRLTVVALALLVHPLLGLAALVAAAVLPPPASVPAARRCRRTPDARVRAPRIAATLEEAR